MNQIPRKNKNFLCKVPKFASGVESATPVVVSPVGTYTLSDVTSAVPLIGGRRQRR